MLDLYIDELDTLQGHLLGLVDCFEHIRDILKARVELPEIKKYIQQSADSVTTMKSDFYIISACCRNNGIGINNKLPWRLKTEMDYFNRMTTNTENPSNKDVVIMGRKTWSSIPPKYRPLENRTNVVLSRTVSTIEDREKVDHIFASLSDALEGVSQLRNKGQVWVIGGQGIYEEALKMPQCKRVYLTRIDSDYECDTFFPNFDTIEHFKEIEDPRVPKEVQEEKGIQFKYYVYGNTKSVN